MQVAQTVADRLLEAEENFDPRAYVRSLDLQSVCKSLGLKYTPPYYRGHIGTFFIRISEMDEDDAIWISIYGESSHDRIFGSYLNPIDLADKLPAVAKLLLQFVDIRQHRAELKGELDALLGN